MTSATQTTHLSKLDLFTPSPLHPLLPPLATGSYAVNGGTALMLSTPDVLARRDYIYSLLGDNVKDERYMRTRPAAHERIIKHMEKVYHNGRWWNIGGGEIRDGKKLPKSMQTWEARREYAAQGLERERKATGIGADKKSVGGLRRRSSMSLAIQGGVSRERPIELD
jgi:hypothetical protein